MNKAEVTEAQPWTRPWYWVGEGDYTVLGYLLAIHLLSAIGLILFPLPGWPVFVTAVVLTGLGGLGTTVAFHRALSHRAAKLNVIVEQALIFGAVFNGSGVPSKWVANHRKHHAHSDTELDVSSPRHGGFWWAHLRCLYQLPTASKERWCPDLLRTRYRIWDRLQAPVLLLSLASGYLLFGWAGFFWIGAIRLTYSLHLQATVNSILHMKKDVPDGGDCARNMWWIGPLQLTAWGENWHENHHARPGSGHHPTAVSPNYRWPRSPPPEAPTRSQSSGTGTYRSGWSSNILRHRSEQK